MKSNYEGKEALSLRSTLRTSTAMIKFEKQLRSTMERLLRGTLIGSHQRLYLDLAREWTVATAVPTDVAHSTNAQHWL